LNAANRAKTSAGGCAITAEISAATCALLATRRTNSPAWGKPSNSAERSQKLRISPFNATYSSDFSLNPPWKRSVMRANLRPADQSISAGPTALACPPRAARAVSLSVRIG